MPYTINNDEIQRKQDLIRDYESGKINKEKYEQLMLPIINKENEIIQEVLNKLKIKVIETKTSFDNNKGLKTKKVLYRDMINNYREAKELMIEISNLKKQMRENMK